MAMAKTACETAAMTFWSALTHPRHAGGLRVSFLHGGFHVYFIEGGFGRCNLGVKVSGLDG